MKTAIITYALVLATIIAIPFAWRAKTNPTTTTEAEAPAMESLPYYVTSLNAHQIGYTGTLNEDQIRELHQSGVRVIIRLNGDTPADRGELSIEDEALLCSSLGIRFYYFNIEGRIEAAGKEIKNLLRGGQAVVHCRNGVHRAPAMAAYFLRSRGYDRDQIIELVGWRDLIQSPGPYEKYTSAVLPS